MANVINGNDPVDVGGDVGGDIEGRVGKRSEGCDCNDDVDNDDGGRTGDFSVLNPRAYPSSSKSLSAFNGPGSRPKILRPVGVRPEEDREMRSCCGEPFPPTFTLVVVN